MAGRSQPGSSTWSRSTIFPLVGRRSIGEGCSIEIGCLPTQPGIWRIGQRIWSTSRIMKISTHLDYEVAMQRAGQVMDEATRHLDADRMEEAVQALNQAIASLKSYGPGASIGEAVQQLENLLGRITSGHWSVRERKFSKYRSHSYRKMSSREHWSASEPPPSFKQPPQNPPIPPAGPTTPPAGGSIS